MYFWFAFVVVVSIWSFFFHMSLNYALLNSLLIYIMCPFSPVANGFVNNESPCGAKYYKTTIYASL